MSEFAWFLALAGGLTVALHLLRRPLTQAAGLTPLVGLLAGVLAGPQALGLLHPTGWAEDANSVILWATRLTLALVLMATILSLPAVLLRRQQRTAWPLAALLALRWLVGALAAYFLAHFTLWGAVLAGAALAPADPVLAGALTGGLRRTRRVTHLVATESVASAVVTLPLVLLFALLLVPPPGGVASEWIVRVLLWQTLGGAVLGVALGWLAGAAARAGRDTALNLSWLSAAVALTLVGAATAAGLNEIAAVVAGGAVFASTSGFSRQARRHDVLGTVQGFFVLPVFLLLGAMLPISGWVELGMGGLAAALCLAVLGRLPWAFALARPLGLREGEATPLASLGGLGVASLYLVARVEDMASIPPLWSLTTLTVVLSVLLSAAMLTLRLAPAETTSTPGP